MREIKFRAWDKKDGMFNVITISFDDDLVEHPNGMMYENCKLMQYTGLKDKNNKEIYEGDIVKWYNGIEEVFFGDGKFQAGVYLLDEKEFEVIGNIYENPELLKKSGAD